MAYHQKMFLKIVINIRDKLLKIVRKNPSKRFIKITILCAKILQDLKKRVIQTKFIKLKIIKKINIPQIKIKKL